MFRILSPLLLLLVIQNSVAQSCIDDITPTAPDSRYSANGDGTVTDLQTGLMWQQCAVGLSGSDCGSGSAASMTWDAALQRPQTLNSSGGFAGYSDWRLPNITELASLVEEACVSPAINETLFPNNGTSVYWSSSPYAFNSFNAWQLYFSYGDDVNDNRDNQQFRVTAKPASLHSLAFLATIPPLFSTFPC
ncbi:DUF1566 domain-containing protein [Ectothiorhodospiraceae bacterium BW-2]|nr:DUF1566 domain-containing protein [Ectothiorhodospiraceae bacterium BW-2]